MKTKRNRVKETSHKVKKARGTRSDQGFVSINQNIWPIERDILWRPERFKYVRKIVKTEGCVFCQALETGISLRSLVIAEAEHSFVILNKYPYNTGHILILPRRHCGELYDLYDEEYMEVTKLIRIAVAKLKEAYDSHGFNIGMNLGAAGGAGIPEHLHFHVIPRWAGDSNFFPLIAESKVLVETLEQTFARLERYFQDLPSLLKSTKFSAQQESDAIAKRL